MKTTVYSKIIVPPMLLGVIGCIKSWILWNVGPYWVQAVSDIYITFIKTWKMHSKLTRTVLLAQSVLSRPRCQRPRGKCRDVTFYCMSIMFSLPKQVAFLINGKFNWFVYFFSKCSFKRWIFCHCKDKIYNTCLWVDKIVIDCVFRCLKFVGLSLCECLARTCDLPKLKIGQEKVDQT